MTFIRYIFMIIGLFVLETAYAQETVSIKTNKQPIEVLMNQITEQSGWIIFYNPQETDTLKLSADCNACDPIVFLQELLSQNGFLLFSYKDQYLFILKDKRLITSLPDYYFGETEKQSDQSDLLMLLNQQKEQKATSENKVYIIGESGNSNTHKTQISGHLTDFKTGEPIIGAVVYTEKPTIATTTDAYGFYTLQLPVGRHTLHIKGLGLKDTQRRIELNNNGKLDIELEEEVFSLKEITITSDRVARVKSSALGVERLQIKEIRNIPTAFGEKDLLRVVLMLPGVKAVGEASNGFNVRGGATDQNLILFNGGTIYNPTHLFGMFSAFNADVVKEVELYKSSIPAQYGGRISSVLDISGREGNKKKLSGIASIGLLTSRLMLEGPIGKKTSFITGGRTTYSDWMLNLLPEKSGYKDGKAGFYDLNLILDHKFSDKDNIYISGYYSHDKFRFDRNERYQYTNANASVRWRHIFASQTTANFSAGYDHYDYQTEVTQNPTTAYKLRFNINQMYAKADFTHYLNEVYTLDFGGGTTLYDLNPGEHLPLGSESLIKPDRLSKEKALESYIYGAGRWDVSERFSLNAGIRYVMFNALKAVKTYQAPEFRLSGRYRILDNLSFKAGINTLRQYIHKLSNTTIMSPTDTWKLSDSNIKPQRGMQIAAGLYKNFMGNSIETSVEGYYKTMKNYLDYRSGAQLIMNHNIENDVIRTEGNAYGIELMFKKTQGKLNGWLSYSWSRTQLRHKEENVTSLINNGAWYPADYDKPHEIKFAGNYKFTQRYSFSMNCDYSTGRPITLPSAKYEYAGGEFVYYSGRNQYRIPDFFRLDLAFNIEPSHKLTLLTHSSITLGVYNVTGRKNAYSVYYISENGILKGYKMAIFGSPIPYLSYNIMF